MAAPVEPTELKRNPLEARSMHPSVSAHHGVNPQDSNQPYAWAKGTATGNSRPEGVPKNTANSKQAVPGQKLSPTQSALCRVTTFYVGGNWPLDSSPQTAQHRVGQMYVEQLGKSVV